MTEAEKLYRDYRTRLLAFVRRRVGSPQEAEDILQEVFLKLLTKGDTVKEKGSLHGWLYQVTRNAIIDHWRHARRHEPISDELPAEAGGNPAVLELGQCLQPLIQALPETYREALRQSEIQEIPLKQVAKAQGISLPGVKSRIQRGRRKLKSLLLDCCRVEVARSGQIMSYEVKRECC
ncbi:MAG: RNA polymerase sigma factor SigZ [Sulfuricaulis sp.]|nr:RNA polymerase sigma factor SigZ [Sulfuricaulis sp.]